MQGIAQSAVEIVRARPEDIPRLREISFLWLQHCERNGMLMTSDGRALDAWMRLLLFAGPRLVFIAQTKAGEIIGACFWHFLTPPFDPTIVNGLGTYVIEAYRRRGISKLLRSAAAAEATRLGATTIMGVLYGSDQAARESAFEAGFVPTGTLIMRSLG